MLDSYESAAAVSRSGDVRLAFLRLSITTDGEALVRRFSFFLFPFFRWRAGAVALSFDGKGMLLGQLPWQAAPHFFFSFKLYEVKSGFRSSLFSPSYLLGGE